ncbi:unnamed protein product [Ascophyllum nodosum]
MVVDNSTARRPSGLVAMSLAELPAVQKNDMVISLAALLLEDGGSSLTAENLTDVVKATGNEVPSYYPTLFASFLEKSEEGCACGSEESGGGRRRGDRHGRGHGHVRWRRRGWRGLLNSVPCSGAELLPHRQTASWDGNVMLTVVARHAISFFVGEDGVCPSAQDSSLSPIVLGGESNESVAARRSDCG